MTLVRQLVELHGGRVTARECIIGKEGDASIPGCVSQGETRDEALANIREAIAACLEVRAERGLPLTVETQQVEVTV